MFNKIKVFFNRLKKLNNNLNNSLYFYKNIDELPHVKNVWSSPRIYQRYIHSAFILFKRVVTYFDFRRNLKLDSKNIEEILYVNSDNTYHSLDFLKKNNNIFIEQSNRILIFSSKRNSKVHNIATPLWIIILSVLNFPLFGFLFWNKIFTYPNLYFENWGKDYINILFLSKFNSLRHVIFANDHNVENRLFLLACKELKIQTIYLQHASVLELFPDLDYDLSFLYGKVDFKKYGNKSTGLVKLVGSPKFDKLFLKRRPDNYASVQTLGIAVNTIDISNKIILMVNEIIKKTTYKVILRTHADDTRNLNFTNSRFSTHSAAEKSLDVYLSEIDFLISGESSIHLESLYINVPSVYFNFTYNSPNDYYHFLKEKLISVLDFDKISDNYFIDIIRTKSNNKILQKFIHSFGKSYDGNVAELIINKIRNNCDA